MKPSKMLKSTYLPWFTFLTLTCTITTLCESKKRGCTAPQDLPDRPFYVVWNHPTASCEDHGIHLDFAKWGIVDNNKDRFFGDKITIFYTLGHWPRISNDATHQVFNGGIPQLGDLTYHLLKAQGDIKTLIPNNTFDGLGVLDFESWRPIFSTNFDALKIYQQKSIELAQEKFPSYNKSQVLQEATKEFELAARSFVGKTLQQAQSLRPKGRWGYYGYPRCWDSYCNSTTITINDKMSWIFKANTALYPSIYFYHNKDPKTRTIAINKTIHETLRVKAKWSSPDAAILPYAKSQNGSFQFYTPVDLMNAIGQPADMGSSGVVLWGSSNTMHAKNECVLLQHYINSTLGPFSLNVSNFFSNCTQKLCTGHGRCVRKDYESVYQYYLRQSGQTDCLIPEERLVRKRKGQSSRPQKSDKIKGKVKDNEILKYESETSASVLKEKLLTDDNILKRLKRDTEAGGDRDKWFLMNGMKLDTQNEENEIPLLQNSVKDSSEMAGSADYKSEEKLNFEFPTYEYPGNFYELDAAYDFDDYVCKCFAGWSGVHCEVKDEI